METKKNVTIGVLSDTHLNFAEPQFREYVKKCFSEVDIIFHAGDLVELSVLDVFHDKEVYAVHGNMCGDVVYEILPTRRVVKVRGYTFGLSHGDGFPYNIEDRLWSEFGDVDCIVYGHTHRAACHMSGTMLFVNPGSFTRVSRHGEPGTYAIIEVGDCLEASIHTIDGPDDKPLKSCRLERKL
jgi:putative phosphoesterase